MQKFVSKYMFMSICLLILHVVKAQQILIEFCIEVSKLNHELNTFYLENINNSSVIAGETARRCQCKVIHI